MFIVLLKFGANKSEAAAHMAGHNAWIAKGFEDGVFQCVGSLSEGGGAVVAHGETREAIEARVQSDPFVEHGVVSSEIYEVDPKRTSEPLSFLKT